MTDDDLLTRAEVSALVGRAPGTVSWWVFAGHLAARWHSGRHLFRRADALACAARMAASTMSRAARTRAARTRVSREPTEAEVEETVREQAACLPRACRRGGRSSRKRSGGGSGTRTERGGGDAGLLFGVGYLRRKLVARTDEGGLHY